MFGQIFRHFVTYVAYLYALAGVNQIETEITSGSTLTTDFDQSLDEANSLFDTDDQRLDEILQAITTTSLRRLSEQYSQDELLAMSPEELSAIQQRTYDTNPHYRRLISDPILASAILERIRRQKQEGQPTTTSRTPNHLTSRTPNHLTQDVFELAFNIMRDNNIKSASLGELLNLIDLDEYPHVREFIALNPELMQTNDSFEDKEQL